MKTSSAVDRQTVPASKWFRTWLGIGGSLAVLLFVNSVLNYAFVSRRIVTEQLRKEIGKHGASIERQLRQGGEGSIASAVTDLYQKERERIAWIDVRTREGVSIAHAGGAAPASFSNEDVRNRMRDREPIWRTRSFNGDDVVVELFPARMPKSASRREPTFAHIEIAIWSDSATAAFWPVRRNLIINCSAAIAPLVALVFMALRFRSYVRGRRLEHELEVAKEVQQALLPASHKAPADVCLAGSCTPASTLGGDFYDVFSPSDCKVAIVTGDVSGKGIPAALLMGVIHGSVRSTDWHRSAARHEEASVRLNRLLCECSASERFASMFWGYRDARTGRLHFVNAGHCPPLLVRSDVVEALDGGGPVLGLLPNARYEQHAVDVDPGDVLVLYSDGLVEATNGTDEQFGFERIRAAIERSQGRTPEEIRRSIISAVREFTGGARFEDDLTLAVLAFDGTRAKRVGEFELAAAC
jgi:hypothetical protein